MQDEFFIGYSPTPPRLRRRLTITTIALFIAIIAVAVALASQQRSPGDGRWDTHDTRALEGVYFSSPYTMILTTVNGAQRIVLLVGQGKVAATSTPFDRYRVRVSGTLLHRGNLQMLEVSSPIQRISETALDLTLHRQNIGERNLRGQVVDPKCFAGAMKPGDGKTHKACAALCLRGGIPPAFAASDGRFYLLVGPDFAPCKGQTLNALIRVVGEPIGVRANVVEAPGLSFLEMTESAFQGS